MAKNFAFVFVARKTIAIVFAAMFFIGGYGQSFFKPLSPLNLRSIKTVNGIGTLTLRDSSYFAFRPIVTAAIVFVSGYTTRPLAGTGVSWQSITYHYATARSYCNFSLSAVVFAVEQFSAGVMLGMLNNNVGIGVACVKGEVRLMFSSNINFNN